MEKTTKNGIHRITQADGKTIAWAEESGVKVLEKDGYYFKDLAKTGELLPYEDWRLSDEERAADLAGRLSIEEIAGLMLYSPHQAVPPMPGGPFQGTFVCHFCPAEGISGGRTHPSYSADECRKPGNLRKVEQ